MKLLWILFVVAKAHFACQGVIEYKKIKNFRLQKFNKQEKIIVNAIATAILRGDYLKYKNNPPDYYYEMFARKLFTSLAREYKGNYGRTLQTLRQLPIGSFGARTYVAYRKITGTNISNGWDKFNHFVFVAYLRYNFKCNVSSIMYLKECFDELQYWLDYDEFGYSHEDMEANFRGERFAREIIAKEKSRR